MKREAARDEDVERAAGYRTRESSISNEGAESVRIQQWLDDYNWERGGQGTGALS